MLLPRCTLCGAPGAQRVCGACAFTPYCSERCADADWIAHCAQEERALIGAGPDGAPMDCVWPPLLWLGSVRALNDLSAIDAVITVLPRDSPDATWIVQRVGTQRDHLWLDHRDSPEDDLSADFERASSWISAHLERGLRVLVHCRAGMSRSATIVAAYLLRNHRERFASVDAVLIYLRACRPVVAPNSGFVAQLEGWQQ